ncbi:hypothetical protein LTR08_007194 [Meristemomyces frigidus]|nr:hypothetical protein LTR08_007194 [Meristemomyces frigidus]
MAPTTLSITLLSLASCILAANVPTPAKLGDISILAADDLITNDTSKTSAALLLSSRRNLGAAYGACESLTEGLWSAHSGNFDAGLNNSLAYEVYSGHYDSTQLFWVAQGNQSSLGYKRYHHGHSCQAMDVGGTAHEVDCREQLPVLCSQSAPASNITFADTSAPFQVAQSLGSQTLVGFRDFLTFRFMGVRFAKEPERFTYSTVYETATGTNDALTPAPECLQSPNNGSTDCLFLNVWTTYLPGVEKPAKIKPVMVYIYGGGFATGSASNPTNDGGNLAARGDVVVVDLAYRLSTLGFLALNDGVHNGNYWLSDCIAGLEWVQKYVANFGGDPDQVTIFGESAGAETVQALLASPKAKDLFHGAIMQSNYYQPYIPIATSVNQFTNPILQETGCNTAQDQLACLRAYNASALIDLKTISNAPVIDGTYLTSSFINLNSTSTLNSVPVMLGVNRDEEGVLAPLFNTTNVTTGITDIATAEQLDATAIITSGAFPLGGGNGCNGQECSFDTATNQTLRVFNTTTRIATDASFHCSNQFTAYAGVKTGALPNMWFYEFNRTYQDPGYNSNGVCLPPVTATHPNGDPNLEYFKCHAGDLSVTFGNWARVGFPARDQYDKPYTQVVVDYWTAFARNLNPNPDVEYLQVRGYWDTLSQIAVSGPWEAVNASAPAMMELQWNSVMVPFPDARQCAVLGQPLDALL